MNIVFGCCLCYLLGAGTVLLSIRSTMPRQEAEPTLPTAEPATVQHAKYETKEEEAWREQWQELLDYNPYKPKQKGGEMNEAD